MTIKRLFVAFVLLIALACSSLAQTSKTVTMSAASTNSALSSGAVVYKFTITAGSSAVKLFLADAPSTALTWTRSAYVSKDSYTTNVVRTVVDPYSGSTNKLTNTVLYTYATTNSEATVSYPTVAVWNVAANSTVTIEPANPIVLTRGLLYTNSAACDLMIDYMPVK